jgi:LuxR family maltose regulon positive regulatory protein
MASSLLTTKLFIPPKRPELVSRPRLIENLNEGLHCKFTVISAPAGFGKTTLVTEWLDNLRVDAKKETQTENKRFHPRLVRLWFEKEFFQGL